MADNSSFGFFCSQYLLHNECTRGNNCIFIHANAQDVNLVSRPTGEEDFVKGFFESGCHARIKNKRRISDLRARTHYSRLPCYYNASGLKCPYGNGCVYKHPNPNHNTQHNDRKSKSENSGVNMPSTSSQNSASSSSSSSPGADGMNPPSSSTGSKKKVMKDLKANLPHTVTSGAFDSEKFNKEEESKNMINLKSALEDWVNAPEFIPKNAQNYAADLLHPLSNVSLDEDKSKKKLCPYAERDGICKYPIGECSYLHGNICELCGRSALHPFNEEQRKQHTQACIKQHERDMELSFAIARSKEKVCGICFEIIMQKSSVEQRFGILPNCNHCFCLTCIRRWRQAKQFENKIIRACPECRVTSDFVCPSTYWVDTKEEKEKVIENYKQVLSKKDCKYFKKGNGSCPFGNKCFYLHALPDGTKIDVGPPPSHRTNFIELPQEVELIQVYDFYHFTVNRNDLHCLFQRLLMLEYIQDGCPLDNLPDSLDIEDILNIVDLTDMFSDTDESVLSDYEYLSDYY